MIFESEIVCLLNHFICLFVCLFVFSIWTVQFFTILNKSYGFVYMLNPSIKLYLFKIHLKDIQGYSKLANIKSIST